MTVDLDRQLRDYFEHVNPPLELPALDEQAAFVPGVDQPATRGPRIAIAAAVLVLLLISGIVAGSVLLREDAPVLDETPPPNTVTTLPTTSSTVPATTTLPELALVGGSTWTTQLGAVAGGDDIQVSSVDATSHGLIATGFEFTHEECENCNVTVDGRVWLSSDGVEWEQSPHRFAPQASPRNVVEIEDLLIMGGSLPSENCYQWGCITRVALWSSNDGGASWEELPFDVEVFGEAGRMTKIISGGPGLVAVGTRCPLDGSECLFEFENGDVAPHQYVTMWVSENGSDWRVVYQDPDGYVRDLAAWEGGYAAVGGRCGDGDNGFVSCSGFAWLSADGVNWTRLEDQALPSEVELSGLAAGGPGLVAIGTYIPQPPNLDIQQIRVLVSEDGSNWTLSPLQEEGHIGQVGPFGSDLIGVGGVFEGNEIAVTVWRSHDGIDWLRVATIDVGHHTGFLNHVAAIGSRLVVVASSGDVYVSDPD